ncbi:MAG TPA: restriction endonuclease subunit S [Thermoanaerobaculia bacterium]|nr:restriction endonuclease subunit S [Thermoanaerobaculia bacterium]
MSSHINKASRPRRYHLALSLKRVRLPTPPGWSWVALSKIARLESGHTPSRRIARYWNGGIPWIGIRDAREHHGGIIFETLQTISTEGLENSSARLLPEGTVCLSRTASLGYVVITGRAMATSQDFVNWVPSEALDPKYLTLLFIAEKESLLRFGKGSTHKTIYFSEAESFHICLPPKNEQRRIVQKLEELREKSRRARESLDAIPTLINEFRQALLAAAFRGDLTAEWRRANPDVESAAVLLQNILSERRLLWERAELAKRMERGKSTADDNWKEAYKEPVAFDDSADLAPIPGSWAWASLDMIANLKGGLTKGKKRRHGERLRSVPYLRVANVQRGFLDLRDVLEIDATETEIDELRLRQGDILFIEGGDRDKLGRSAIWEGQLPECIHQNHVFRARLITGSLLPGLVSNYANSNGQAFFFDKARQTTNLASISLSTLASLPMPLIPKEEAARIASVITRSISVLARLEKMVEISLQRLAALEQVILERAFRGELVPQDRSDEPASALVRHVKRSLAKEKADAMVARRVGRKPPTDQEASMSDEASISTTHLRDIIQAYGRSMEPGALWKESALAQDIDQFYAQLRREIDSGQVREKRLTDRRRVIEIVP